MTSISFDYEVWTNNDVLLERPGSPVGYAVVYGAIPVGKAPTKKQGVADSLIGPSLEGVIGMLAGSLEWLREYGMTTTELESKVRAFKRKNLESQNQVSLKFARQRKIEDIADAQNLERRLDKTKVLG